MRHRKIGSITPVWNQQLFIKPHFNLLSKLDHSMALIQSGPLPNYEKEHGIGTKKDHSEDIIRQCFPHVEIIQAEYNPLLEYGSGMYNEGLVLMQDCDIVFRLNPDMIWTEADFDRMIQFVDETDYDCYVMNFQRHVINYYITGDFEHGLRSGLEHDPLAVNPKNFFSGILHYPARKPVELPFEDWTCHHFHGWNKPKSTPPGWEKRENIIRFAQPYLNNGEWWKCPDDIRQIMQEWLDELLTWRKE